MQFYKNGSKEKKKKKNGSKNIVPWRKINQTGSTTNVWVRFGNIGLGEGEKKWILRGWCEEC